MSFQALQNIGAGYCEPGTLLRILIDLTILCVASLTAVRLMRGGRASLAHLILSCSLATALFIPLLVRVVPAWHAPVSAIASLHSIADPFHADPFHDHGPSRPAPAFPWLAAASWLWASGAICFLLRPAASLFGLRRISRQATELSAPEWRHAVAAISKQLGLESRVKLLMSEMADVPLACGLIHSFIILPSDVMEWTDEERDIVLCHELAHIQRNDVLANLTAELACAAYWFHPLCWKAKAALRQFQERACDDAVLAAGARPSSYAGLLLKWSERPFTNSPSPAMGAGARDTESRIEAILDTRIKRGPTNFIECFLITFMAVILAAPLASVTASPPGPQFTPEQQLKMDQLGITAEYWTGLENLGYHSVPFARVVKMKKLGIDADFIRQAQAKMGGLSVEDLIRLKKKGRL